MRKTDLKQSAGLHITLEEGKLLTTDCSFASKKIYNVDYVEGQLLNSQITFNEPVFSKYMRLDVDGLYESKKVRINEYVIPPNLLGIEYIKTKAVLSPTYSKIIEVHHGGGAIMLQKIIDGSVVDVIYSTIKKNQKIVVPAGYSMVLINNRQNSPLVVAEIMSTDAKNYTVLDEVQGMSYYIIRKNAKQETVLNPKYRTAPEMRKVKWDDIVQNLKITLKTPVSKQMIRKYDKFEWLFKKDQIEI
jgi:oxalate decarboxylase/phosphoglucose isomerase-like protein (cupin superfamily)